MIYHGFIIEPYEYGGLSCVHEDYDGPGDRRCFLASDLKDAIEQIDDLELEPLPEDENGPWSGGFAENH